MDLTAAGAFEFNRPGAEQKGQPEHWTTANICIDLYLAGNGPRIEFCFERGGELRPATY